MPNPSQDHINFALTESYHARRHEELQNLLPDGVAFNPTTGSFTGTPTKPGEHEFAISTLVEGERVSKECRMVVKPSDKDLPTTAYTNRSAALAALSLTGLAADHLPVGRVNRRFRTATRTPPSEAKRQSLKRARMARKVTRTHRRK